MISDTIKALCQFNLLKLLQLVSDTTDLPLKGEGTPCVGSPPHFPSWRGSSSS